MAVPKDYVAHQNGLAFSISPATHRTKAKNGRHNNAADDDDDEEYVLTLAPFTRPPKINFGTVKLNQLVERNLLIINPQQFEVVLNVSNQDLRINNMEITIGKMTNIDFKIRWQPDKADNYKYSILFEVVNNARLKFLVHAFGVCLAPPKKPAPVNRKPFTMLQPVKKPGTDKPPPPPPQPGLSKENQQQQQQQQLQSKKQPAQSLTIAAVAKPPQQQAFEKTTIRVDMTYLTREKEKAKAIQERIDKWATTVYRMDDDDDDDDNHGQVNVDQSLAVAANADLRRQTCIIASPRYVKRGSLFSSVDNLDCTGLSSKATPTRNDTYNENEATVLHANGGRTNNGGGDDDILFTETLINRCSSANNIAGEYGSGNGSAKTSLSPTQLFHSTAQRVSHNTNNNNKNNLTSTNMSFMDRTVVFVGGAIDATSAANADTTITTSSAAAAAAAAAHHPRTPQLSAFLASLDEARSKAPNTPKFSDFMAKSSVSTSASTTTASDLLTVGKRQAASTHTTRLASTQLIDISLAIVTTCLNGATDSAPLSSDNAVSSTTLTNGCQRRSWLNSTMVFATSSSSNSHPAGGGSYESLNATDADPLLVKCVLACQRAWRRRQLARQLLERRRARLATEAMEAETARVAALLEQNKRENDRIERELYEAYQQRLVKSAIVCQRCVRAKRFRAQVARWMSMQQQTRALIGAACVVQRQWRMRTFRRRVAELREAERRRVEEQRRLHEAVIRCQRARRMIVFRRRLAELRADRERALAQRQRAITEATVACQRWLRMKRFRLALAMQRRQEAERREQERLEARRHAAAVLIQHQWRLFNFRRAMRVYRASAVRIQRWIRVDMHQRFAFLQQRRIVVKIQLRYKVRHAKRVQAAVLIASVWRMHIARRQFRSCLWATIRLQSWWRMQRARALYAKMWRSVCVMQRAYRHYRVRLSIRHSAFVRQRSAALVIQRWHRSMAERYDFLKKRDVIYRIQQLYRRIFMPRRHSAAACIQRSWRAHRARLVAAECRRVLVARRALEAHEAHLHACATRIQATWRGYSLRKSTNPILVRLRDRISFYMSARKQSGSGSGSSSEQNTLGARVVASLKTLRNPQGLPQLMCALTDLEKVTMLSPECCAIFSKAGAIAIVYDFIGQCNRSVPHIDMIKMIVRMLTNLAKYAHTVERILEPAHALSTLQTLFQSYQTSQPGVFMDLCALFIVLAKNASVREHIVEQRAFVHKLVQIHAALERKRSGRIGGIIGTGISSSPAIISASSSSSSSTSASVGLTTAATTTCGGRHNHKLVFSLTPEWSLCKKETIELCEPYGALDYLLNKCGLRSPDSAALNSATSAAAGPKRPLVGHSLANLFTPSTTHRAANNDKLHQHNNGENRAPSERELTRAASLRLPAGRATSKYAIKAVKKTHAKHSNSSPDAVANDKVSLEVESPAGSSQDDSGSRAQEADVTPCDPRESIYSNVSSMTVQSCHSEMQPKMNSTTLEKSASVISRSGWLLTFAGNKAKGSNTPDSAASSTSSSSMPYTTSTARLAKKF